MATSPYLQRTVHLMHPDDLLPSHEESQAAAVLELADGQRIPMTQAVLNAVNHVIDCAAHDYSPYIVPFPERVWIGEAVEVTTFPAEYFHDLIQAGELDHHPDALGGTVPLADVLALEAKQEVIREIALQQLAALEDEYQPDDDE